MKFLRKLPIPLEIKEAYPLGIRESGIKEKRDLQIKNIFTGQDRRLLLLCGPCSADREDAVLEYLYKLQGVAEAVSDKILIIPRVYGNKPRTTGLGYKGMLHQPDPDGKPDILGGLIALRKMYLKIIAETGFTVADELLYPENYRYFSDLLSYVAVGARSVENQQHRLVAGGLDIPVGMKNTLRGDVEPAWNAVLMSRSPQTFLYRGWEVVSEGNPLTHVILRGGTDKNGKAVPNYSRESLLKNMEIASGKNLDNTGVIVDVNHGNSGKDYARQPEIAFDVLKTRGSCRELTCFVKGIMIESYLIDGCQPSDGHNYGQSITDPCLGWKKTENLIYRLAELL